MLSYHPQTNPIFSPLHQRALECAKRYKRGEKELIDVLQEIDKSREYFALGCSSLFRYCTEKLGLGEDETFRLTRVARKAVEVPALKTAIAEGVLTAAKAARIAPVITVANQEEWIGKASTLKHRELERAVKKERPEAERLERVRVLNEERSELRVTVNKDVEEKLRRAQVVFRTVGLEETLAAVLDFALERRDPLAKAKRAKERLTRKSAGDGGATTRDRGGPTAGPAPGTCRVAIPAAVKHQVNLRDLGRCQVRGCGETSWTDLHHIKQVSRGGDNSLGNLVTLCWRHHRWVHGEAIRRSRGESFESRLFKSYRPPYKKFV